MATPAKLWTMEEFRTLPDDGRRYELIDGILIVDGVAVPDGDLSLLDWAMTPAPPWTHQLAVTLLATHLTAYVHRQQVGYAIVAAPDVPFGTDRVEQPDICIVPAVDGRMPRDWTEAGRVLLVVEVLSPSTAHRDKVVKRELYLREGVPEYWIVDVDSRAIDLWRSGDSGPLILDKTIEWQPAGAPDALVIDLEEYFEIVDPWRTGRGPQSATRRPE